MARLTCPSCEAWLVDVSDHGWRVTAKADEAVVLDPCADFDDLGSSDLWADLDLVNARSEEWRDRGVYDPLPPPPDPPNSSVLVRCRCGVEALFARPG
jgi:hypothetical protein